MKVLVIADHYPPYGMGGYEIACEVVTEGLRRRGHEVRVLTSVHGAGRFERSDHVERVLHRPQDSAFMPQLGWWELRDRHQLERIVASWRPHVVYAWKLLQLFPSIHRWLARCGVPIVFNLQDLWFPEHLDQALALTAAWHANESGGIRHTGKSCVRAAVRLVNRDLTRPVAAGDLALDHVIFCSRFRERQHAGAGFGGRAPHVIYNGVDLERFTGDPRRASGDALKLLFVGRLVEGKGLHTVIDALAALRRRGVRATLTVSGIPSYPFEYRGRLDAQIAALGLTSQVSLRAPVGGSQLAAVYRAHDVLVFPSVDPEGFPMTLLEAAACGLAIVGTTTGGSGEFLVDDDTGLVFSPHDVEQLVDRLTTLARQPATALRLAASAQRRARTEFAIDRIAAQTETCLAQIAA